MNLEIARRGYYLEADGGTPSGGGGETTPAAAPTTPAPVGDGGTFHSSITDTAIAQHPSLQTFKDVTSLAKAFVETKKMVGANPIAMPKDDAEPAEWDKFYNKLGRPEKADDYKLELPSLPEGHQLDEARLNHFKPVLHKLGLSNKAVNGVVAAVIDYEIGAHTAKAGEAQAATQQAIASVKEQWGDNYNLKMHQAELAAKAYAGDKAEEFLSQKLSNGLELRHHPVMREMLANAGAGLIEDSASGSTDHGFTTGPDQAKAEIERLRSDKEFMEKYRNPRDLGNKEAVARMVKLYEQAQQQK